MSFWNNIGFLMKGKPVSAKSDFVMQSFAKPPLCSRTYILLEESVVTVNSQLTVIKN